MGIRDRLELGSFHDVVEVGPVELKAALVQGLESLDEDVAGDVTGHGVGVEGVVVAGAAVLELPGAHGAVEGHVVGHAFLGAGVEPGGGVDPAVSGDGAVLDKGAESHGGGADVGGDDIDVVVGVAHGGHEGGERGLVHAGDDHIAAVVLENVDGGGVIGGGGVDILVDYLDIQGLGLLLDAVDEAGTGIVGGGCLLYTSCRGRRSWRSCS